MHLPLETFIARAVDVANENLPSTGGGVEELFNDLVGDKDGRYGSRGAFVPEMGSLARSEAKKSVEEQDIYDILTGSTKGKGSVRRPTGAVQGQKEGEATNVFSVMAGEGEEKRAKVFLGRMKGVLESEPGRLVL